MSQWYYARQGQTFGPYSPEQLRALAMDGTLLPDDMVAQPGAQKWVPASTVGGLVFPTKLPPRPSPQATRNPSAGNAPWFAQEAASARREVQRDPSPAKSIPLKPISVEKTPSPLTAALLSLPKPILFGLFGGVGGLLGALLLGEILWLILSPSGIAGGPPLQIAVPNSMPIYAGGRNKFVVKIARHDFQGPVKVEAVNPGEQILVRPVEIPADKDEAEVEVQVADGAGLKNHPITIRASAPAEKAIAPVTHGMDVNVQAMPPGLAVVASPKVEVDQGGTGRFTVKVRRDRFEGDINLHFTGLPAGATLADQTIPAAKTDATVDLRIPYGCPTGKTQVALEASSQMEGARIAGKTDFALVVLPKPVPTVDVVFVLDLTGSMQGFIDGLKKGIQGFVQSMEKETLDVRIGVVCFRDLDPPPAGDKLRPYAMTFEDGSAFTKKYAEVEKSLAPLRAGGGGDTPESSLQALQLAANQDYRPTAKRVLILITDAIPKIHAKGNLESGDVQTIEETIDLLKKREIDQFHMMVRPDDLTAAWGKFQKELKGEYFPIKINLGTDAFASLLPKLSAAISRITVASKPKDSGSAAPPELPPSSAASFPEKPDIPVLKAVQSTQAFAAKDSARLLVAIAVWTMVIAGFISLFIVAGQQFHTRQALVDLPAGVRAIAGGLLAGLAGGAVGQWVFQLTASESASGAMGWELVSRLLGWSFLGGLIGVVMAFFVPNLKWSRGMAGGVLGGVLGAMAFVIASLLLGALLGRWMGAAILGFCIGLMVALAELAFRRWWLEVAVSAKEVRTVTLGTSAVSLGSDEKRVSFFLAGAPAVALRYRVEGEKVLCQDETTGETLEIAPGDRRNVGKVAITLRSPESSQKTGYAINLNSGRSLELQEGMPMTAEDFPGLQSKGTDGIVALVNRHPTQPREVMLRNRSLQAWAVRLPNGTTQTVEPGRGVELADGLQINFGQVQGLIVLDKPRR